MNLDKATIIENDCHIFHPGEKVEFIQIEFTEKDPRKNFYPEGIFEEKELAVKWIKQGLAKLKIIPKADKSKEFLRCKILHRGLRRFYADGCGFKNHGYKRRIRT